MDVFMTTDGLLLAAGWAGLIILFLSALAVVWRLLTMKSLAVGLISEPKKAGEEDGKGSLSRLQALLFTFVVAFCLYYITLKNGAFGEIPMELIGLLGVSLGGYAVSKNLQK